MAVPAYAYLLIIGAMLAAAVATVLAGRRKRAKEGEYNSDALGFVGGVMNALFIVVLAFYTVITWTETDSTEQHAETEASDLIEIYWQVAPAAAPERTQIRALITEYTHEVVDREWSLMDQRKTDPKADDLLVALRSEITRLPADNEVAAATRDQALQNVRAVADERRARVNQATSDNTMLRLLLLGTIIGAVAMIAYPLLIGFSADLRHVLSLVGLAGILAFTVYFSVELDRPFGGLIKVGPDAFQSALTEYTRIP